MGNILIELKDLDALRSYLDRTVWPKAVIGPGGADPNVGRVLILGFIELGRFEDAEQLLRPMRKHPEVVKIVEGAERRMLERKRELRVGLNPPAADR